MSDVQTTYGPIRGERIGDVRIYRGIPFAAPPVGPRRWQPPAPPGPWQDVRDATRFGDDCPQRSTIPIGSRATAQSEDCLTLNVWTPAKSAGDRLPVMVWIFGGSFIFGSGAEERADGMTFARDGVVYVAINYRVGMFGFLAHPGLTAESRDGTSGNYGLLDQIAGLQWVRDNIDRFGGDPDRVTLFGVSAGAAAISLLMTSPLAQGLFQQVILQSPGRLSAARLARRCGGSRRAARSRHRGVAGALRRGTARPPEADRTRGAQPHRAAHPPPDPRWPCRARQRSRQLPRRPLRPCSGDHRQHGGRGIERSRKLAGADAGRLRRAATQDLRRRRRRGR
jgi:carboxylesterase type B